MGIVEKISKLIVKVDNEETQKILDNVLKEITKNKSAKWC